jgi:hypothetical protein
MTPQSHTFESAGLPVTPEVAEDCRTRVALLLGEEYDLYNSAPVQRWITEELAKARQAQAAGTVLVGHNVEPMPDSTPVDTAKTEDTATDELDVETVRRRVKAIYN